MDHVGHFTVNKNTLRNKIHVIAIALFEPDFTTTCHES